MKTGDVGDVIKVTLYDSDGSLFPGLGGENVTINAIIETTTGTEEQECTLIDADKSEITYIITETMSGGYEINYSIDDGTGVTWVNIPPFYGDEDSLLIKTKRFSSDITSPLLWDSMQEANDWINSQIDEDQLSLPYPYEITRAATLYASAAIIDSIFASKDRRSPTATTNEGKAKEILENFLNENPEDKTGVQINVGVLSGHSVNHRHHKHHNNDWDVY